ncbi:putative secreted protein [Wickerhamomyces ciferrii]|uniref:Secreted protein n=1 Tax=Wickerhamomyces ciferrii (strain ATCC 14091 / BCRC 22168 / CBS 111 / JCM 3599 / NBRC 0793 / NRRL Y-1031 F-60-10) TaxID=1206466 RepID=K0KT23_WICCF|nr:uncharacterized protein BN7_4089 [Wickerhamomyces ciferrii]CCH44524.1 putative secreted protein [Wickerhamomyces ciferrii]
MQLSTVTLVAIISTLLGSTVAAPVNITESANGEAEADVPGTSQGVEFPFSKEAIIEAVSLGNDIAPIVLDDAVYFINTTIVDQELGSKLGKREAWNWRQYLNGSPNYKREAEADAEAWQWRKYLNGSPNYKREAEADAEAWQWRKYLNGSPNYKREAAPEAEAWQWRKYLNGSPNY